MGYFKGNLFQCFLFVNLQFLWVPFKRFLLYPDRRAKRARELVRCAFSIKTWCLVRCAQEVSFYEASVRTLKAHLNP